MTVRTWTVDQVCSGVGAALEACFPDEFWIRGEIQGLRRSPAGHMYFDLIEPGARGTGTDAKLGIVAFRRRKAIRAWWDARRGEAEAGEPAAMLQDEPAEARSA